MNYPALIVKPKAEKALRNRHPWLFSGAVQTPAKAQAAEVVAVQNTQGQTYGYGFYAPDNKIRCRLFHWGETAEDFESVAYWQSRLETALHLRRQLVLKPGTDACRIVHAEGDGCPGLILDLYKDIVVGQILTEGMEKRQELIAAALENLGLTLFYQKAKATGNAEEARSASGWVRGEEAGPVVIQENGLKFTVDVEGGQKTGFFLDQRDNRALVGTLAKGKTVLNAFSYTGGFSIYALAGGAKSVDSVDISEDAVQGAEDNVRLNFPEASHRAIAADCFKFLREMPEDHYDLIVLDPPAFAKSAGAVENAARGYKQINLQAMRRIKSGGLLFTFSCSQNISKDLFQKIVFGAAADAGRPVRILYQLHQPADHPINIYHPEGEYLKGLVVEVGFEHSKI